MSSKEESVRAAGIDPKKVKHYLFGAGGRLEVITTDGERIVIRESR